MTSIRQTSANPNPSHQHYLNFPHTLHPRQLYLALLYLVMELIPSFTLFVRQEIPVSGCFTTNTKVLAATFFSLIHSP